MSEHLDLKFKIVKGLLRPMFYTYKYQKQIISTSKVILKNHIVSENKYINRKMVAHDFSPYDHPR